ncbi:hypothetical protein V1509DRAFT_635063 [Lipomyces kononenkoae]
MVRKTSSVRPPLVNVKNTPGEIETSSVDNGMILRHTIMFSGQVYSKEAQNLGWRRNPSNPGRLWVSLRGILPRNGPNVEIESVATHSLRISRHQQTPTIWTIW